MAECEPKPVWCIHQMSHACPDDFMSLSHIHKDLRPFELANTQINRHLEKWCGKFTKKSSSLFSWVQHSKRLLINWSLVLSCEGSLLNRWCSSRDRRSYSSRILFYKWLNHSKSQRQYHYTYLINTVIYTPANVQAKKQAKRWNYQMQIKC